MCPQTYHNNSVHMPVHMASIHPSYSHFHCKSQQSENYLTRTTCMLRLTDNPFSHLLLLVSEVCESSHSGHLVSNCGPCFLREVISRPAVKMMKHAAADAKEKLGNVTAKVEEKMDNAKASATEKTDKAMAHDKAGKLEAKERKHERQAEAQQAKDLKQVENAREVGQAKEDIAESKVASHDANHKQATEFGSATPLTNAGLTQQATGAVQAPGTAIAPGI